MQLSSPDQIKRLINQFLSATKEALIQKLDLLLPALKGQSFCPQKITIPALSWPEYFKQLYMDWIGFFFQPMEDTFTGLVQEILLDLKLALSKEVNEAPVQNTIMLAYTITLIDDVNDYLQTINEPRKLIYMLEFFLRALDKIPSLHYVLKPMHDEQAIAALKDKLLEIDPGLAVTFKDANLLWSAKDRVLSPVAS